MTVLAEAPAHITFDNSFARLGTRFYVRQLPTRVSAPRLVRVNGDLARELGLDAARLSRPDSAALFAGNSIPEGAEPIATAYAGHQFGGFSPQLGDGRAILLGEVVTPRGERFDIQLKGSGPTPFSRRGDGRAALGPVLREYIVSEAMHALGIPTTRTLAAVTTGDAVFRDVALPGAVLTRVASSHIRVGTFQFFAARGDTEAVRTLADYVIGRHYPDVKDEADPYAALLEAVIARQARLVARWMLIGFIHGVMNTDNTSIAGETIDYGPCAFMDTYDPKTVYSSIDRRGRYAFENQPVIAQWNLTRFAECLLPLLAEDKDAAIAIAQSKLDAFGSVYADAYGEGLRAKLGLFTAQPSDLQLGEDLLAIMKDGHADFTLTFRRLADAAGSGGSDEALRALFDGDEAMVAWLTRWRERLTTETATAGERQAWMYRVNPGIIPRNHTVEAALAAAVEKEDFAPFHRLVDALADPFVERAEDADLMIPPKPEEVVRATFCGT